MTTDGTHLSTLSQVEVERHESSPSLALSQRHDLVFQPLAAPEITVEEHTIDRTNHEDMRSLYTYLDTLASAAIQSTLRGKPMAGTEVWSFLNLFQNTYPLLAS